MTAIPAAGRDLKAYDCTNASAIIECGDHLPFEITDSFSLEFWVFSSSSTNGAILGKLKMLVGGIDRGYAVHVSSGKPGFFISPGYNGSNNDWLFVESTSVVINDSKEHHVLCTYAGTSLHTGMKIYIDGVAVALSNFGGPIITSTMLTDAQFIIGGRRVARSGNIIDSYKHPARVHDVGVYNAVLTAPQAAARASKQMPRPSLASLVAYWPGVSSVLPTVDDIIGTADGTATAQVVARTL
jgi:hypothetical protein